MTHQVNIWTRTKNRRETLVALFITTMIIAMSVLNSQHSVNAKMMGGQSDFANNTSLSQAMVTAEKSVGNNSFAIAGFGTSTGRHLAYTIIIGTHGPEYYNVTVDPRNGQILATEQLTQDELEKAHLEHSQKVLTEPHLMNDTFVH